MLSALAKSKLLSLIYKVLTTNQPSYLHNLITFQPPLGLHLRSQSPVHLHYLIDK